MTIITDRILQLELVIKKKTLVTDYTFFIFLQNINSVVYIRPNLDLFHKDNLSISRYQSFNIIFVNNFISTIV